MDLSTLISDKDRKFLERVDSQRILSKKDTKEILKRCRTEVKKKLFNDPNINEKNPHFVTETFNDIFKQEKILVTNLRLVWNPYDETRPQQLGEGLHIEYKKFKRTLKRGYFIGDPKSEYKFILRLEDPKEVRNVKLKIKRRRLREIGVLRICKECNNKFKAVHKTKVFCSNSCKMRDYRRRKKLLIL